MLDKGSVDSSDTFQSCQTHPYLSQEDVLDEPSSSSNLYVNPFDNNNKNKSTASLTSPNKTAAIAKRSNSTEDKPQHTNKKVTIKANKVRAVVAWQQYFHQN
jgi:hypothetical protein